MSALVLAMVVFTFFFLLGLSALVIFRSPARQLRAASLAQLRSLSPKRFEQAIATLLADLGYKDVKVVGGAGDLARDVAATEPNGVPVTVQCKHYPKSITSPQMQLFIGMLKTQYQGSTGIYATTSGYTAPARALGQRFGVRLWDGNSLARLVTEARQRREAFQMSPQELLKKSLAVWQRDARSLLVLVFLTGLIPSVLLGAGGAQELEWFWGSYLSQPCCASISVLSYGPVGRAETVLFCLALGASAAFYLRPPKPVQLRVTQIVFLLLVITATYQMVYPYQFPDQVYLPIEEFLVFLSGLFLIRTSRTASKLPQGN